MSANICEDESSNDFGITEKLKSTGRISLSDITAATIGPLDAATWETDQSESASHDNLQQVHRPWSGIAELTTNQQEHTEEQPREGEMPRAEELPRTEHIFNIESLEKTDIYVSEKSSRGTVISLEPLSLPVLQAKRKLEIDDSNSQKRVRTDPHLTNSYGSAGFQLHKGVNSKQFQFSALAQSINEPEHSTVKAEPQINFKNDFLETNSNSANFMKQPLVQPWAPVGHALGPHVTSIPVGSSIIKGLRPSATYSNPDSVYQRQCFQPWVNQTSESDRYAPITPIKNEADSYRSESNNILQKSHGYSTPISAQKVNQFDCHTSLNSPVVDSRFNDSLTSLLGSPHTASPVAKNPYFSALQNAIESDGKNDKFPHALMDMCPDSVGRESIFNRERKLHERFNSLQETSPDEVRQLSGFYRYQTALIETERFRTLHESKYPLSYKNTVNQHFDEKLHSIMDRVEQSIILLENTNKENKYSNKGGKPRPHLNKEAVKIFEEWYQQNLEHPYPSSAVYDLLALKGGVSVEQVKKWFANKRNRTHNTRTLTEIAMKKRKLNHYSKAN